jgi:hypothetical protein
MISHCLFAALRLGPIIVQSDYWPVNMRPTVVRLNHWSLRIRALQVFRAVSWLPVTECYILKEKIPNIFNTSLHTLTKYLEINVTFFGVLVMKLLPPGGYPPAVNKYIISYHIKCYKNVLRGFATPVCLFTFASKTSEHLIGFSENFAWDSCIKIYRNIQNLLNLGTKKQKLLVKTHVRFCMRLRCNLLFSNLMSIDVKIYRKVGVEYNSRTYSVCYL